MSSLRSQRLLLTIMFCSTTILLNACTMSILSELNPNQLAHAAKPAIPATSVHTAPRMPATQTSCPANKRARAAVMTHMAAGDRQNLVYTYNTSSAGILRRYDISAGKKTTILSLNNATISNAQLSTDGQFILFATQVADRLAIQMVRIDGQGLQTLYCMPDNKATINFIDNLLWSPDQQSIVFAVPDTTRKPNAPIIRLLHANNGQLQTILTPTNQTGYIPRAWFSNTLVYMQGYSPDEGIAHDVYQFDIQSKSIKRIALIQGYGWDLSLTPDNNELLLCQNSDMPPQGHPLPPSIISEQPASGGKLQIIYASHVHAVTQVRSISPTTLLFVLGGRFADDEQDGLWKINTDGSGLTLLTRDGKVLSDQHTLWSSLSRDGRMYAATGYDYTPGSEKVLTRIVYGPLQGGPSSVAAITQSGESAEIVGWTVL